MSFPVFLGSKSLAKVRRNFFESCYQFPFSVIGPHAWPRLCAQTHIYNRRGADYWLSQCRGQQPGAPTAG